MTNQELKPCVKVESSATADAIPSTENLLAVPPAKATLVARFPPGCLVLYTNTAANPLVVSRGTVDTVFVDLSPEKSSRDYVYKLLFENEREHSVFAGEAQLQWAPQCPVWMKPMGDTQGHECAIVVGSYQDTVSGKPQYSVMKSDGGLFHGVGEDRLRYRASQEARPTIKTDPASLPVGHASPALAKTERRSSSTLESPTSVIDALTASDKQGSLIRRPQPVRQVSATTTVGDAAMKRSPPSEQAAAGFEVAPADGSGGQQAQSAAPRTVGDFSNKTTPAGKRSPPSDQSITSSGAASIDGNGGQQAPPPKKARVAHSVSPTSSSARVPLTSEMLLQNSASEERKEREEVTPPHNMRSESVQGSKPAYTSQMLLKSPVSAEPGNNYAVETSGDGLEDSEDHTAVIKIPQFADPIHVREAIIGEAGKNHKRLLRDTGCRKIRLDGHNSQNRPNAEPMKVTVVGDSDRIDSAQHVLEDVIANTVPEDQVPRMRYYLAVENNYGASEGLARYQRSPFDDTWIWMSVVECPQAFENCTGLFMDTRGRGVKEIVRTTGCRYIHLSNSFPKYVFVGSDNLGAVNAATESVKGRIQWALQEYERRKNDQWS